MVFLVMLLGVLGGVGCSTYKYDADKGCYSYKPAVCVFGGVRTCSVNAEGCRTCSCQPQRGTKEYEDRQRFGP